MYSQDTLDTIQSLYIAYFQRPADPAGLLYWAGRYSEGTELSQIIAAFSFSQEAQRLYGIEANDPASVITKAYQGLFNREPEAAGLTFYIDLIASGQSSLESVMMRIVSGARGEDRTVLDNKIEAADRFTLTLDPELDGEDIRATYSSNQEELARAWLKQVDATPESVPGTDAITQYLTKDFAQEGDPILEEGGSGEPSEPQPEPDPEPQPAVTYHKPSASTAQGASDASTAIALDDQYMIVGDDEGGVLRVYHRAGGEAVREWSFQEALGSTKELDLEASALLGNRLYVIGSHSNSKDGGEADNREYLFSVDLSGTGENTQFDFQGSYAGLEQALVEWDEGNGHGKGAGHFGFKAASASGRSPEQTSGFSIEGLSFSPDNSTLWLAFRAPQTDTTTRDKALIIQVENIEALLAGNGATPSFGEPIELNLGGRGIRSIDKAADGSGYLIIAGPAGSASSAVAHDFRLFTWSGEASDKPVERDNDLDGLLVETGGSFETIVAVESVLPGGTIQLLQDNGDTVWPGRSEVSKDLDPHEQQFVGNSITLGKAVTDAKGPVLQSVLPADDTQGAAVDLQFVLTFDEGVRRGEGRITLHEADGSVVEAFDVAGSAQVSVNYNIVTVRPSEHLAYETGYYLTVESGAITDHWNNAYAGFDDAETLDFVTSGVPTPLAAGDVLFVGGNAEAPDAIAFALMKDINGGTRITFTDRDYSDAAGFAGITNEMAFVWTADRDYKAGTFVTVQTDVTGNPIADKGTVVGGGGGVGKTETLYALQGTVIDALGEGTAGEILETGAFLASLTLGGVAGDIPAGLLAAGSAMSFTVDPANQTNARYVGSLDDSDIAALIERIKDPANWEASYTKAPGFGLVNGSLFGAPLLSRAEVNEATLTLTWNQPLDETHVPAAGDFSVTVDGVRVPVDDLVVQGPVVSLALADPVKAGMTVLVDYADPTRSDDDAAIQLPDGTDADSWSSVPVVNRSPDEVAPALVSASPEHGSNAATDYGNIVLTFDEIVTRGAGDIILKGLDGAADIVISVADAAVGIDGNSVTIDPDSRLEGGRQYAVLVENGAFTDVAGNPYAGISDAGALSFTTEVRPIYSLLVSEVNSNAEGGDFLELYNHGDSDLDLSGWKLNDSAASFASAAALPDGTLLAAGEKLVIVLAKDVDELATFKAAWGLADTAKVIGVDGPGLGGGDAVVLFDAKGYVATAMSYALASITASDGTVVTTAGTSPGTALVAGKHAGEAYGGGKAASAVWDGLSVEAPTYKAAAAGELGAIAQAGEYAGSVGSPGGGAVVRQDGDSSLTLISAIQGTESASAMLDRTVVIEGVVTAYMPDLRGFFVQEEVGDSDGNAATSEGIFVYYNNSNPGIDASHVGDVVRLSGKVGEYAGQTQLTMPTDLVVVTDHADMSLLPAPVQVTLPVADMVDWEAVEGMLVQVSSATPDSKLVVTDNYNLGRYGTVTLTSDELLMQFTEENAPSKAGYEAYQTEVQKDQVILDDGSSRQNPATHMGRDGENLSAGNTLRAGDSTASVVGVVDQFTSSGDLGYETTYRIQPTIEPVFIGEDRPAAVDLPASVTGAEIKVASVNVLNYFNTLGSDTFVNPNGSSHNGRGASDATEFARQEAKLVEALLGMDADVVGLMEIQSNGYAADSALAALVNALNAKAGAPVYAYISSPFDDGAASAGDAATAGDDAIMTAFIFKPGKVVPVGQAAVADPSIFDAFSADYGNRVPVAQTFEFLQDGERFTVVSNHFKSKGSVIDPDLGDGQGANNLARMKAAEDLLAWLGTRPTGSEDADILLLGDFNGYSKEDPVAYLEANGYDKVSQGLSYSFDGLWGSLDHVFASDSLAGHVAGAAMWAINAEEPGVLDYNLEYKNDVQDAAYYAPDAYRSSDHNPILVGLNLGRGGADVTSPVFQPASGDWLL